jgi:hypothetical protein
MRNFWKFNRIMLRLGSDVGKESTMSPLRCIVCGLAILFLLMFCLSGSTFAEGKKLRYLQSLSEFWFGQREGLAPASPSIYTTENFAVYYQGDYFPKFLIPTLGATNVPSYIVKLGEELEFAYLRLKEQGFKEPGFAEEHLVTVFVTTKERIKRHIAVAEAYVETYTFGATAEFIAIQTDLSDDRLKSHTVHELFHVFQDSPNNTDGSKALSWLFEGTAVWVEDEVHPYRTAYKIGYPPRAKYWWREWGRNRIPFSGIPGDYERKPKNSRIWYGNAILFKYWTEHLDGGKDIIKEMLFGSERMTGEESMKKVFSVITAHSKRDFPYELLRAAVGTYLLDGPDEYNLKRGKETKDSIGKYTESTHFGPITLSGFEPYSRYPKRGYYKDFTQVGQKISSEKDTLDSFAAQYSRIEASDVSQLVEPTELFLSFKPDDPKDLRLALIEYSNRFGKEESRVTILEHETREGGGSYVIPRFANDPGETTHVDLVVVNGGLEGKNTFTWSYAVSPPPYLQGVKIYVDDEAKLAYEAEWSNYEMPDVIQDYEQYKRSERKLEIKKNVLPEESDENDIFKGVRVELKFSERIEKPDVYLGSTKLEVIPAPDDLMKDWTFRVDEVEIAEEEWEEGELTLRVENAMDVFRTRLDGDPATRAILSLNADEWDSFEDHKGISGEGGEDRNHKMAIKRDAAFLKRVLFEAGGRVYYDAEWQYTPGSLERNLSVRIDIAIDPENISDGRVKIWFNNSVNTAMLSFGSSVIELKQVESSKHFIGVIKAEVIKAEADGLEIRIQAGAITKKNKPIDANPKTVALPAPNTPLGWTNIESLPDKTHKVRVKQAEKETVGLSPLDLFTFEDAVLIAPGVEILSYHGWVRGDKVYDMMTEYSRSGMSKWEYKDGLDSELPPPEELEPETTSELSGVSYEYAQDERSASGRGVRLASKETDQLGFVINWSNWGEGEDPYPDSRPEIKAVFHITEYDYPPSKLINALEQGIEEGHLSIAETTDIEFDLITISSEYAYPLNETKHILHFNAAKGNIMVSLKVIWEVDKELLVDPEDLASEILERLGSRLGDGSEELNAFIPTGIQTSPDSLERAFESLEEYKRSRNRPDFLELDPSERKHIEDTIKKYKEQITKTAEIYANFLQEINPGAHKFYPKVIDLIKKAKGI